MILDRTKPPSPGRPSSTPFPDFVEERLSNGIPLYLVPNHAQPYVSLQLVLRSGASSDGELAGLAEFTSSLLLSGAGELGAQELAEEIDFLGATLDASAGRDEITVGLGLLTVFLERGLDLMADVVLRPRFEKEEVLRERKQAIAGLKQNRSDPSYLAAVQFRREVYGDTPYGTEVDGTEESLRRIGPDECRAFHQRHFTAGNAFFVAAGDVRPAELRALLDERFGGWSGEMPERPPFAPYPERERLGVVVVDRASSVQAAIRIGGIGIDRRDPDYITLAAVSTLLGGYFNSRINNNLRERNGFTYGARSVVEAPQRVGSVSIAASVGADVADRAIEETLKELETIISEPVGADELQMVKNYIVGSQALQTETPGQVASFVRTIALYDLPRDYYRRFPEEIRRLAPGELLRVAQRVFDPSRMVAVAAGSAAALAGPLERIAPLRVVDEKGKAIPR